MVLFIVCVLCDLNSYEGQTNHFIVDSKPDPSAPGVLTYKVKGNSKNFYSLVDLAEYYQTHAISKDGKMLASPCVRKHCEWLCSAHWSLMLCAWNVLYVFECVKSFWWRETTRNDEERWWKKWEEKERKVQTAIRVFQADWRSVNFAFSEFKRCTRSLPLFLQVNQADARSCLSRKRFLATMSFLSRIVWNNLRTETK